MARGTVKTSAILVATRDKTEVYRTIQDMPFPLRRTIARLASGPNSRTLLIADQRGLDEWLSARGRAAVPERQAQAPRRRVAHLWLALAASGLLTLLLWSLGLLRA